MAKDGKNAGCIAEIKSELSGREGGSLGKDRFPNLTWNHCTKSSIEISGISLYVLLLHVRLLKIIFKNATYTKG